MSKRRAAILVFGLLVPTLLAGCAKQPPSLLDRLDQPTMSREEVRARLYDFVIVFTGEVETAMYEIANESNDIAVAREALVWATGVVPAMQSAVFQSDPGAGLIDAWALCLQQRQFFEEGAGKDAFAEWHYIALDASRSLVEDIEAGAQTLASPDDYARMKGNIDAWVAENPIESLLFARTSTVPLTTAALWPRSGSTFAAVGSMADEVRDLSARLSIYSELVPKQARWQAALLLTAEAGGVSIIEMLRDIEVNAAEMQRISAFLDSVPDIISIERDAVMNGITAERIAVMAELHEMLAVTLEAIAQERAAVMTDIGRERVTAFQDLEAISTRISELAIDHFYWRAVQLLAVLSVLLAVAGFFTVRYLAARLGTRPLGS
jgi:hypothetical protein